MELPEQTALFRETSDEYFDRSDPLEPFGGRPAAMSFIDGMHLVEYALRDFINVERHSTWTSVVVFDDIFPADAEMAARRRQTFLWTGDVYKILGILARYRSDLICLRVDTEPTGLLLVLGLDPDSTVLDRRYDEIVLEAVRPDPQRVPAEVLERQGAVDPEALLSAPFWSGASRCARSGGPAAQGPARAAQLDPARPRRGRQVAGRRRTLPIAARPLRLSAPEAVRQAGRRLVTCLFSAVRSISRPSLVAVSVSVSGSRRRQERIRPRAAGRSVSATAVKPATSTSTCSSHRPAEPGARGGLLASISVAAIRHRALGLGIRARAHEHQLGRASEGRTRPGCASTGAVPAPAPSEARR